MRISDVANETGLSASNIRFYEKKGLLSPDREKESKYRDYSQEDIRRLKQIVLYRKMNLPVEMIFLILNGETSTRKVLERQKDKLIEQQHILQGSIDLCCRVLGETDLEQIDVDYFLNYVKEEEDKGQQFAVVEELLDDVSDFYGISKFRSDPWIGEFFQNKWAVRGISLSWLLTCILLPITQIYTRITAEESVQPGAVLAWLLWGFVVMYPFYKFRRYKAKSKGEARPEGGGL